MKNKYEKTGRASGALLGATLLAGLVCAPLSSAYVDENLIDHADDLWWVTPASDSERDADTVQYAVDMAAEGDTIFLLGGTFDFGAMDPMSPGNGKSVTVSKSTLNILGSTRNNALGEVEAYHTTILAEADPFITYSTGVLIQGIRVGGGPGDDWYYTEPDVGTGEMVNMSVRVHLDNSCTAIPGVVINDQPRMLLIRAVGSGLAPFEVGKTLANPKIEVYRDDQLIDGNCDWCVCKDKGAAAELAAKRCGAFPLKRDSLDSALVITLDPGAYTFVVCSEDEGEGEVLLEVYGVPSR